MAGLMLLGVMPAAAQFDASAVTGSVRDASGGLLPGATVTLTNKDKGTSQVKTTDSRGLYEFESVPIGTYTVSILKDGFAGTVTEPFTLEVNTPRRLDVELKVASANDTVTVTGAPSLLEKDTSDLGTVVESAALVDLPLDGRSYADLVSLTPGAHISTIEDGTNRNREASFNVNGLRSNANNFLMDGLDNNSYSPDNSGFSNQVVHPSPDAIAEFKVQVSNFSAEYGRAGGAIINATTRSGSNVLHGSMWDFFRNTALNAWGPFYGLGVKPVLIQNQFGGTLGGPIVKDKLFFFGDYEGLRQISKAISSSTLPTVANKSGFFQSTGTNTAALTTLTNPFTGKKYTTTVGGVQVTQVPVTDMTPFARAVIASLPDPNAFNNTTTDVTEDQYLSMPRNTDNDNKGDIRLDAYLGPRTVGFTRFTMQDTAIYNDGKIPGPAGGDGNGNVFVKSKQWAVGLTRVVSATSVLDFRLGLTWTQAGKTPGTIGQPSLVVQAGIPGLPVGPFLPSLNYQDVQGYSGFGQQISNPALANPFTINPKVNYTLQLGRHALKAGYEFNAIRQIVEEEYPLYGADSYTGQFSRGTGATAGTVREMEYNLADFMFGARSEYQLTNYVRFTYRQYAHYAYLQDDWKIANRLTLNLGVRYELVTPPEVDGNTLSNFDPATNTLIPASNGSIYNRALVHVNTLGFAPRLGFAFAADPKTVLRGGYGISYVQFDRNSSDGFLAYNGPWTVFADVNQTGPSAATLCPAGSQSTTCFRTTQEGYPTNFTSPANFSPANTQSRYNPAHTPTGYVQSYHLGMQHQIDGFTTMDISYVGAHGVHLHVLSDWNQAEIYPGDGSTACPAPVAGSATPCLSLASRRPIQGFQDITVVYDKGFLLYNGLQAKIQRRLQSGLFLLNSFTWGQGFDNASTEFEANNGDSAYVNFANPKYDKGRSSYNQTLNDTTSVIWQVPFGKGKRFGATAPRAMRAVFGEIKLTALNLFTSGEPVNAAYTPSSTSSTGPLVVTDSGGIPYSYRPNVMGNLNSVYAHTGIMKTNSQISGLYTAGVLVKPTVNGALPTSPFGNFQRNSMVGPAYHTLTLGLAKEIFRVENRYKLEFRVEAFNALNEVNYGAPDADLSDTTFGELLPSDAFPARRLQLALKATF